MIKINDKYKTLFEQPKEVRYYVVTGGRASGKSYGVNLWACLSILGSDSKILFTRYTLTSAEISIIPEFREKIELLNVIDKFQITKGEIKSSVGGEILFRGIKTSSGQQTANLKSLAGVNIWILDEAEELHDEKVFDKINLSIRHQTKQNIVILILNPTLKEHWIYKRFFEQNGIEAGFNGIKGDTCYIHTSYLDNIDNVSESFLNEIERIKQNNKQKYYNEILGGWLDTLEGVLFEKESLNLYTEDIDVSKASQIYAYVDVATSKGGDYHCCVIGAIIDKKMYIVDVVYTQEDSQANIQLTAQILNKYKPEFCRIESNGVGNLYSQLLQPYVTHTQLLPCHNSANKQARIFQMSGWIKDNVYFKCNSEFQSPYYKFFKDFTSYLMDGSSKNDDSPDSVWGLSVMAKSFSPELFES